MFPTERFRNKHILVGITGGIAAYKAAELVRYLIQQEAEVRVVMTSAAGKFISPLTMETLSQHAVATDLFPENAFSGTHHINLADWADAAIIAPASYDVIGKLYSGIADDLLTTIWAAIHCPTVIAPAMNVNMWNNPILQRNIDELSKLGYLFCPPEEGFLAEGYSGKGRLAPLEHLIQYLYRAVHPAPSSLSIKKVLVTAGKTEEPIDPVRVISNRSSGKMGLAMAWEAFARGASVKLIHGPMVLPHPVDMEIVEIATAEEMYQVVKKLYPECDIFASSAAVADYTPAGPVSRKIKKKEADLTLELSPTVDILKDCGENRTSGQQLIGFAVETDSPEETGAQKLNEKNLDMIVVNNPREKGAGFDIDTNIVTLMHRNGAREKISVLPKLDVAFRIFDFLLKNQS
ncbi:MAG: bifunctional phosphopantothenoylcysteine decarboxylase/phosphopantothenate--cysteine ligase CoaBC [Calditrichaeota bacterium]|nr:bifunctional phosphopantothenoylcysteine decarboxylase/phosphopantothenate--cysteine ligase CoaBC [Calditrichota bacterium]RQW08527.1 MAG: bifunctional phosphopantothenoylcysteine decarboxylase/phosphopantothenate--cysteine ligase CoaBC [Calditrichota bacterium]